MSPFLKQIADQRAALNETVKGADATMRSAKADLAKLDQLEALTRQLFPDGQAPSLTGLAPGAPAVQGVGTVMTKKAQILNTVEEILSDGRRRTAAELVKELAARGVIVGGNNENNNLSAYLSPDERFNSDRVKGGWGLSRPPKKTSPGDAGTSSGLFGSTNGAGERHPSAG